MKEKYKEAIESIKGWNPDLSPEITNLISASIQEDSELFRKVLDNNPNIDINVWIKVSEESEDRYPLLHVFAQGIDYAIIEELLVKGANPDLCIIRDNKETGWTTLFRAIEKNLPDLVKLLNKYNVDTNLKYISQSNIVSLEIPALHYLLKYYFFMESISRDEDGNETQIKPLDHLPVLQALLENKNIDFTLKDSEGNNVLDYALQARECKEIVAKIIEAGGWELLNQPLNDGKLPIFEAIAQNNSELIKIFMAYGASLNSNNSEGMTALELIKNNGDLWTNVTTGLSEVIQEVISSFPKDKFMESLLPSIKSLVGERELFTDEEKSSIYLTYIYQKNDSNKLWEQFFLEYFGVCKYNATPTGTIHPTNLLDLPPQMIRCIGEYIQPSDLIEFGKDI